MGACRLLLAAVIMATSVSGFSNLRRDGSAPSTAFVGSFVSGRMDLRRDICMPSTRPPFPLLKRNEVLSQRRVRNGLCALNAVADGAHVAAQLGFLLSAVDIHTLGSMFPHAQELLAQASSVAQPAVTAATAAASTAASNAPAAADAAAKAASNPGIFDSFVNLIEQSIVVLHSALKSGGVGGAWGLSIIIFTVLIKILTFPLNYKQMATTVQMQSLQPKLKALQSRYQNDPQTLNQMTAKLYQDEQVNPFAGCLPTLVQIPIFIALYRALLDLAKKDLLTESFLWIPSLQGPVGEYSPTTGLPVDGTAWLFKGWTDGHPAMGWADTLAYLSIPIILVITQTISQKALQPPQSDDPAQQQSQQILKFLPLMIGWFALNVPAGLGVYWVANNALSTAQQFYIREKIKSEQPQPPASSQDTSDSLRDQLKASAAAAAQQRSADELKFKVAKRSTETLVAPPPAVAKPAPKPDAGPSAAAAAPAAVSSPPAAVISPPAAVSSPTPAPAGKVGSGADSAAAGGAAAAGGFGGGAAAAASKAASADAGKDGGEPSKSAQKKKAKAKNKKK